MAALTRPAAPSEPCSASGPDGTAGQTLSSGMTFAATPTLDLEHTTRLLVDLLNIPSPTGYTEGAVQFIERELQRLGVPCARTPKGGLLWTVPARATAR